MKFTLTFKCPDVLDQIESDNEDDIEAMKDFVCKFLRWDEYIQVEFDPKNGTATVLSRN